MTTNDSMSNTASSAAGVAAGSRAASLEPSQGRIPRRHLEVFLLLGLRRLGTSYGYELYQLVRSLGLVTDLAGVYRSLRSLHGRNLVAASWSSSQTGPDRRLYALTEEGIANAEVAGIELVMLRDALSEAIVGFNSHTTDVGEADPISADLR